MGKRCSLSPGQLSLIESPPESLNVRESGQLAGWLAGLCVLEKEGAPLGEKEAEAAPHSQNTYFPFSSLVILNSGILWQLVYPLASFPED